MNNPNVTITLSLNELQVMCNGLAELPFKVSAQIMSNVQQQVQFQLQQQEQAHGLPTNEAGPGQSPKIEATD
jgi:hypothetical protein